MSESEEKYLRTVYTLTEKQNEIRSIDVAAMLGYSKASVSRAMKNLKENNYIIMKPYGRIALTPAGYKKAETIIEREAIISGFLQKTLGLTDELSLKYSIYMAHFIDQETLNRMRAGVVIAL